MSNTVKNNKRKKLSVRASTSLIISACFLLLILGLSIMMVIVFKDRTINYFKTPELNLPVEESFALKKYNYEELSQTITTIRSDIMNVTKRGLQRGRTSPLSDVYTINNLQNIASPSNDATIDFKGIYPSAHNPGVSVNASTIATHFSAEAQAMFPGDSQANNKYFYYYKYMLMSQGYNLALEAQKLSALTVESEADKNNFKTWLKKHPAADAQYGACVGENNAVEKEITIDPIYRSPHVTGLYLPAGEVVTVKVEGLKEGEQLGMTIGLQNSLAWRGSAINYGYTNNTGKDNFFFNADIGVLKGDFKNSSNFKTDSTTGNVTGHNYIQSQWGRQNARLPWLIADFTFSKNGTYLIGTPFGGIMHINPKNCYSNAKTIITGAVETPHYILGVTTPEYFDTYLRNAPGPGAVLDTENGQLICAYGNAMRTVKTEEIDKLAMLWHSFFSVNESFTGGTYNRFNKVMFDIHVPAGAAVALGNYSFACPTSWFNSAMSYRGLIASGSWGILHEIGHNHASSYGTTWGFGDGHESEVRNNALTVLGYIMFCDTGTSVANGTAGVEHGFVCHPYNSLVGSSLRAGINDYAEIGDYFKYLTMYTNIMHSFGAEKFYELLYTYKNVGSYVDSKIATQLNSSTSTQKFIKRVDFTYRCSLVYGMNFLNYYNNMYKANLTQNMFTEEQWTQMQALPNYEPIACRYAGAIDGVKTGGDWIVTYGKDIEFDLLTNTYSSLDTNEKKGFKIISVNMPSYGTIRDAGEGKYVYSFNNNFAPQFDEISFKVQLDDGTIHQLTITLRINYPTFNTYLNVGTIANAGKIKDVIANKTPNVEHIKTSGIPNYLVEEGTTVAKKVEYYWQAPKTGKVKFNFKYNKGIEFYFGNDFNSIRSQGYYSVPRDEWISENNFHDVIAGEKYAIRLLNYCTEGEGYANLGYRYENEDILEVSFSEMCVPSVKYNLNGYVFESNFITSKKDGIKVGNNATNKSEWKVLKAVTDGTSVQEDDKYIQDGRTDVITRTEMVAKENAGDLFEDENTTIVDNGTYYTVTSKTKQDKWNYLIDGDTGTILHTTYGKNNIQYCNQMDYEFIIDTNSVQQFNYFSVTTRNGALSVSKITKFELQISNDNVNYTTIAEGDVLVYKGNIATLNFDNITCRYFKLVAKGSTGNNGQFVVIAELDAGITSHVQRLVPATSGLLYHTKGWQNTANISSEQSGFLLSEKKKQKLVFRFEGTQLSLYAAVGEGFGKADLIIDGKKMQTINFNSSTYESRKLKAIYTNLEDKVHTVEIITKDSGRVMINMFGINYTSNMLNAPNIYLEKSLTIALVVFILLFLITLAFILCLMFIPKFRKFMGNNKAINKLDEVMAKQKEKRKIKREEKKKQKQLLKANQQNLKTNEKANIVKREKTTSIKTETNKPTINQVNKTTVSSKTNNAQKNGITKQTNSNLLNKTTSKKTTTNAKQASNKTNLVNQTKGSTNVNKNNSKKK